VYRDRLDLVEEQHEELCKLVETLLAVIEKSTGRVGDETVPRITGLAEAMLEGREIAAEEIAAEAPPEPATEEKRPRRAKRDIRDLVSRVTEARRAFVDDEEKPEVDDKKEIEILRAELNELGERLGVGR